MTKTNRTAWVQSIAALLLVGAAALPASAQITTGNITGTVKDAQGGVVPGATVTLIDEARGTKLAPAVTNETGSYTFPNVTAATYTVEVTMSGFKTARAQRRAGQRRRPRVGPGDHARDWRHDRSGHRHGRVAR